MTRGSVIITTAILLCYFVFTSGLVYEAIGSEVTDRLVVPYNLALSGERTGLTGIYTEDDQRVAEWLVEAGKPVVCDGNMGMLLRSYGFAGAVLMTAKFESGVFSEEPHLVAFSTWNIETGKAVVDARSAGMRTVDRLPEIDRERYREVFRSGKAVVFEYAVPTPPNISLYKEPIATVPFYPPVVVASLERGEDKGWLCPNCGYNNGTVISYLLSDPPIKEYYCRNCYRRYWIEK